MKQITPQQLADWLQDTARPAPVLLDVREPSEFSYCAIPGSLPMPMASVPARLQELDPPGVFARTLSECLAIQLRALNRLKQAQVVVHDRLIAEDVLALIPAAARRVYVGKALGHHAVPQEEIHDLLVGHARQGLRVVRLKGGDPYVFGRGGEEVLALQAAGIAFEVVPGVTAASGCSAAAGIPLTHRHLAASCVFLPGHLADDQASHDWQALAGAGQTRVFYMGVQRLAQIAQALIAHGLPPERFHQELFQMR